MLRRSAGVRSGAVQAHCDRPGRRPAFRRPKTGLSGNSARLLPFPLPRPRKRSAGATKAPQCIHTGSTQRQSRLDGKGTPPIWLKWPGDLSGISANAFGSHWAQSGAGTCRLCDPLSKERRFIPLRLDDAPIKGSLTQSLYKTPPRPKELRLIFGANLPFGLAGTTIQSASHPVSSFLNDPKSGVLGG